MEIVKIVYNGRGVKNYSYSPEDSSLIKSNYITSTFNANNDYIEFFIFDENQNILYADYNYSRYKTSADYSVTNNNYTAITLDPESDLRILGYDRGLIYPQYNFCTNLFNSSLGKKYWIKEISNSRTELKLSSQTISGNAIRDGISQYQNYSSRKNYYPEFYLNFGNNDLLIAVNAAYIEQEDQSYLLIKLYEPLPLDIDLKKELWIVDKVAESVSYQVNITVESDFVDTTNYLRRPNFNIRTFEKVGQTTPYYSYNSLFSSPISSSTQQLLSYYEDKAININVDYSDFSNFIHFSSAVERISNFTYKTSLIESYTSDIISQSAIIGNTSTISSSIVILQSNIDRIIEKFDTYEYFLYYDSGSYSWPKRTSTKPYVLYSVTSSEAINWLGDINTIPTIGTSSILYEAYSYDSGNKDILRAVIPQYLQDDANNDPYLTFVDMIGQHFDNIWIYYKDVSNRFNASNNPFTGISLDMVADAIKSFGISLYTNTNLSNEIYYTLFGIGQSGTLLPPTGSEGSAIYPISYVTSSLESLPYNQIEKEIYKRLYHNLPYLLKTKGTRRAIKALIACYGIPEEILTVNEFGGYDRLEQTGIWEINNDKINIISQSLELSESILSPYATVQYYDNDNRLNSTNLEIGFSPSDKLNLNISSSLGYFDIDSLIGNPQHQYSSSYPNLEALRTSYFSTYTNNKSIWEYIRLIKFYNNSLFKIIKDFVPARSNVSTGIIIKPHILERNKYARHEPSASNHLFTQSIDMVSIEGSFATWYSGSDTTRRELLPTSIGYIPFTSSFGFEKYTGEFQGSEFNGRYSNAFEQRENSENPAFFSTIPTNNEIIKIDSEFTAYRMAKKENGLGSISILRRANFQNIENSVRSVKYLDLDYSSNINTPVNFNIITASISRSLVDNYSTYTNPDSPYARIQDFYYLSQRSTIPRYYGSKVESLKYNIYTAPSTNWKGDKSYGNSAAIDHKTQKIALFTQVATSSFFPGLVNATLGYLVDQTSGLFELNLLNNNWFEVQNTFKSGKTLTIKQFDNKKYGNQKSTDGIKSILESGYSYSPILYYATGIDNKIYFNYFISPDATLTATNNTSLTGVNNRYISGSASPSYPLTPTGTNLTASMYDIFNVESYDGANSYTSQYPAATAFPTYSVPYNGNYTVGINFNLDYKVDDDGDLALFSLLVKRNGVTMGSFTQGFQVEGIIPTPPTTWDFLYSAANWKVTVTAVPQGSDFYRFYTAYEFVGPNRSASGSYDWKLPGSASLDPVVIAVRLFGTTNVVFPGVTLAATTYAWSNISTYGNVNATTDPNYYRMHTNPSTSPTIYNSNKNVKAEFIVDGTPAYTFTEHGYINGKTTNALVSSWGSRVISTTQYSIIAP